MSEKLIQKNEIDSDDIPLTEVLENTTAKNITENYDNEEVSESNTDEMKEVSESNTDIFIKKTPDNVTNNQSLDNLVVLSKSSFLIYSAVVFLAGMSFESYFYEFKR